MKEILNIIILYSACVLFFITISGYGNLAKKLLNINIENIFDNFFWGLIFVFILQFFLYLLYEINFYTNYIIIFFGIYYFLKNSPTKDLKIFFLILFLFFIILIIGKTHEDFKHHHLQMTNVLFQSELTFGLSNLNPQFIYIPSLSFIITLTKNHIFQDNFYHIIPFLIFINLLCYLRDEINKKNTIILLILLVVIGLEFKFLKKHGFDVPSFIFAFYSFLELLKNKKNIFECLCLFIFALSIKITPIFGVFIIIYLVIKNIKKKNIFLLLKTRIFIFTIFLFFTIIFTNFINNGCLIYFVKASCFSNEKISWAIDHKKIEEISKQTELDAKGFFIQNKFNKFDYLKKFNWFGNWFKHNFFYKIFNYILYFIISFLLFFFFLKLKIKFKFDFMPLLISFLCMGIWFITIPTLRYGYFVITVSVFLILSGIQFEIIKEQKYKMKIILLFLIIIINTQNFFRIKSEFKRSDANYFLNFPWYYIPERQYNEEIIFNKKFFKKNDNFVYPCWNIPSPCIEEDNLKVKLLFNKYVIFK